VVADAVPALEEAAVFGGRRKTNLTGGRLEGVAVVEEAVAAVDAAEPERVCPLLDEAVAAVDGVGPKGDPLAKAQKGLLEDVVCGKAAWENALEGTTGGGIADGA